MKPTMEQARAFLVEYRALCEKYGVYLWSCGCCGSPDARPLTEKAVEEFGYEGGEPIDYWQHLERGLSPRDFPSTG